MFESDPFMEWYIKTSIIMNFKSVFFTAHECRKVTFNCDAHAGKDGAVRLE